MKSVMYDIHVFFVFKMEVFDLLHPISWLKFRSKGRLSKLKGVRVMRACISHAIVAAIWASAHGFKPATTAALRQAGLPFLCNSRQPLQIGV